MADLPLSLACWNYDRTRPLMDGRVKPEGIDLKITILRPQEAFRRMLTTDEFQISEMSFSSFVSLKSQNRCPFVAIPVMLSKMFRHDCVYVRTASGVKTPRDLIGKRIGAIRYSSTGLVFVRGLLQHDFGVSPSDIEWFVGGLDEPLASPRPDDAPADVRITPIGATQTLMGMFEAGELDAIVSLYLPDSFIKHEPTIARLFPDFKAVELDYFKRTGIFPIMHTVVIREDVHKADPWIAKSMYKAFCEAKDVAMHGLYDTDALHLSLPFLIDHIEEAQRTFGENFYAYGFEENRTTIEAMCQYMHEQTVSPGRVSADSLFLNMAA